MTQVTKKVLRSTWKSLPSPVRKTFAGLSTSCMSEAYKLRSGMPTLIGLLENIRKNGFTPTAIVDVGANVGNWSRLASSVYPSAHILMLDADSENESALRTAAREIGSQSRYFIALLGPEKKQEVTFYKMDTGSSVFPELTSFAKKTTIVPMDTLDSVIALESGRLLLKLDVQGFELEVLRGGRQTLKLSEVVIIETSLLPYNEGAPLIADVIAFMRSEDFELFDFCGQLRRESDDALFQTDVVFARRNSMLRNPGKFWTREP
jgi:FkbM family methyltransferase